MDWVMSFGCDVIVGDVLEFVDDAEVGFVAVEVVDELALETPNSGDTRPPSTVLFQTSTTSNPEFVTAGSGDGAATQGH